MKKLPKIEIPKEKIDINLKFYFFIKSIVQAKLSETQVFMILENAQLFSGWDKWSILQEIILERIPNNTKSSQEIRDRLLDIFCEIDDELCLSIFLFGLKLYLIKDLLLEEAKVSRVINVEKLKFLDPLSLEYDKSSIFTPYKTRVSGALLTLSFFNCLEVGFLSESTDDFFILLSEEFSILKEFGLEVNQIFMLIFNESLNQSIKSNSGSDYENRIKSVLLNLGIDDKNISKTHDLIDKSTEFDFFIELCGKKIGIGAKRTLRERYKQFIKTTYMSKLDAIIEITLGTDLTEDKANAILKHGVYLFVSDEVYQNSTYLHKLDGVYSCRQLSVDLLLSLSSKQK